MARLVFEDVEQLKQWLEQADPTKYIVYVTTDNEIVMKPIVDPRSRDIAYVKVDAPLTDEKITEVFKGLYRVYKVKHYEWRTDVPVGVKITREEL